MVPFSFIRYQLGAHESGDRYGYSDATDRAVVSHVSIECCSSHVGVSFRGRRVLQTSHMPHGGPSQNRHIVPLVLRASISRYRSGAVPRFRKKVTRVGSGALDSYFEVEVGPVELSVLPTRAICCRALTSRPPHANIGLTLEELVCVCFQPGKGINRHIVDEDSEM
jgi:hypothetical protein